jgi:hypothetical protein
VQTLVHGGPFCQLPVASHVCGVVPLHCIDPGAHTPVQRGVVVEQTNPQTAPSVTLCPVISQKSGCKPWHLRLPGLQSEHTPSFKQTVQATASRQTPVASQVWDMLTLHRLVPGTHIPAHAPPEQRNGHKAPLLAQCPVMSQVCGWLMLQRGALGVQSTQVPLPRHTLAQGVPLCQVPAAVQVCGTLPTHCELPGVQTPVQAPALQTNGHVAALVHWPAGSQVWGTRPLH